MLGRWKLKDFDDDGFDYINFPKTFPVVGAASDQEGLALEEVEEDVIV